MLKIAFVADVHIGNHKLHGGAVTGGVNERCRLVLDALASAVRTAAAERCRALIVCGDLFDTSNVSPQIIAETMTCFSVAKDAGMEVVLLNGNHDQNSNLHGDTALAPFAHVGGVRVVDKTEVLGVGSAEVLLVPFAAGVTGKALLKRELGAVECARVGIPRVLVFHLGIADTKTAPWLRSSSDSIDISDLIPLLTEHGVNACVAGNWHDHRVWDGRPFNGDVEVPVVQCGALVPTGWDNPGAVYGRLVILTFSPGQEAVGVEVTEIPGPRFFSCKLEEVNALLKFAVDMQDELKVFLRVTVSKPEEMQAATDHLALLAQQDRRIYAFDVDVDDEGASKAQSTAAAQAVASAASIDESISGFTSAMPLVDGVDRDEVHRRLRDYLRR